MCGTSACPRSAPTRCAAPTRCIPIADLQIEYSLISRGIEAEILPACRELGIGVTAYGVLSRGLLSGHWSRGARARARRLPQPRPPLQRREPRPQPRARRGAARGRRQQGRHGRPDRDRLGALARRGHRAARRRAPPRPARRGAGRARRSSSPPTTSPRSSARCRPAPPPASATTPSRWRSSTASGAERSAACATAALTRRPHPRSGGGRPAPLRAGQGHGRRRRPRARRQPRQRLPALPQQGGAARRRHRALARPRLGAARGDRRRGRPRAGARCAAGSTSSSAPSGPALDDPELFATYVALAAEARDVVTAHVDTLTRQLARIIADGVARGEFAVADPASAARAVFDATGRFHNPAYAPQWSDPTIDAAFDGVWSLLLAGLGGAHDPSERVRSRSPSR